MLTVNARHWLVGNDPRKSHAKTQSLNQTKQIFHSKGRKGHKETPILSAYSYVTFSDDFFAIFAMQQQDLTQGREDFSRAKTKEWFSQQGHEGLKDVRLKIRLCGLCGLCCICVNLRPFHPGECSPESFRGSGLRLLSFLCVFAALREISGCLCVTWSKRASNLGGKLL
jgi:hypothetical protein